VVALGSTLLPLLSPYSATPQQPDQSMIDQAITPRGPMRYARTPEYFANFKEHAGDWGVYLGACIMGKVCQPFSRIGVEDETADEIWGVETVVDWGSTSEIIHGKCFLSFLHFSFLGSGYKYESLWRSC